MQTLIRMHKAKMEEEQKKLSALEAVANGFTNEIAELHNSAERESSAAAANLETGHMLGDYIQATIERRKTLEHSRSEVESAIAAIRGTIAEAFRELKRFEIIEERRLSQERQHTQRRQSNAENELGLSIHRRKSAGLV
ncbi:MAG: hypothetical protein GKS01_06370 [Alphaproteobacteria bacterium]|nr:hypothetical protein [Alphaproteobacteria bacterium]